MRIIGNLRFRMWNRIKELKIGKKDYCNLRKTKRVSVWFLKKKLLVCLTKWITFLRLTSFSSNFLIWESVCVVVCDSVGKEKKDNVNTIVSQFVCFFFNGNKSNQSYFPRNKQFFLSREWLILKPMNLKEKKNVNFVRTKGEDILFFWKVIFNINTGSEQVKQKNKTNRPKMIHFERCFA